MLLKNLIVLSGAIFCFMCDDLFAQNDYSPAKVKDIYEQAQQNMDRLSYSTILEKQDSDGKNKIDKFFHKVNPDGTVYTRQEFTTVDAGSGKVLHSSLFIVNDSGQYHKFGDSDVIKINFQLGKKKLNESGLDIQYSLKDGNYHGIPCYVITRNIKPDDLAYGRWLESLPDSIRRESSNKQNFHDSFSTVDVSYVGKKDMLIYKTAFYSAAGKYKGAREYGKVSINQDIDDDLFKIKSDEKITTASNISQYSNTTFENTKKDVENRLQQQTSQPLMKKTLVSRAWDSVASLPETADNNFEAITTWGARITFWLAVFAFIAAVILKVRNIRLSRPLQKKSQNKRYKR